MAYLAAHRTTLSIGGTPTTATGAATTNTTGNIYRINTAARRVIDPATAVVVYDGGSPVTPASIDYLFGTVTLSAPPGGAVTLDYKYVPLLPLITVKEFEINAARELADSTPMDSTTTVHKREALLADASGTVGGFDYLGTDIDTGTGGTQSIGSFLVAGAAKFLDVAFSDGTSFRAWVNLEQVGSTAAVDSLVEGKWNWQANGQAGVTYTPGATFGVGTA